MRLGEDWVYDEAQVAGYVQRIAADGSVQRLQPFAPPPEAAVPAPSTSP
jgi:hypothetical protein